MTALFFYFTKKKKGRGAMQTGKIWFQKNGTALILVALVITAFLRGAWQTRAFALAAVVFALAFMIQWVRKQKKQGKTWTPEQSAADETALLRALLLRHVNCRVTGFLQSVYPETSWEWVSENPVKIAAEGGIGRIRLYGVPDREFADITMDATARIGCELLQITPLAKTAPSPAPEKDAGTWFAEKGKAALDSCVAELTSRGYVKFGVRENGDIFVTQKGKRKVLSRFTDFPKKSAWRSLAAVLDNAGFSASVADDAFCVAWQGGAK
jgi:hypothetical protein